MARLLLFLGSIVAIAGVCIAAVIIIGKIPHV